MATVTVDPDPMDAPNAVCPVLEVRTPTVADDTTNAIQVDKDGRVLARCPDCEKKHTIDGQVDRLVKVGAGVLEFMEAFTDVVNLHIYDGQYPMLSIESMTKDDFNHMFSSIWTNAKRYTFTKSLRVVMPKGVSITLIYR